MKNKSNLKIAAFLDGRPGHEKQTMGVIGEIRKRIDVEVISVAVQRRPVAWQILDWITFVLPRTSREHVALADCDLLFGTGTHTHLPMLQIKKLYAIPVAICMTPVSLLAGKFDLIFSPLHDNATIRDNVYTTVGPPNPNSDKGEHQDGRVLLLCGGADEKSHIWDSDAVVRSFEALINCEPDNRYVLSTSPRTPLDTAGKLKQLAEQHSQLEFHDFQKTPGGWVEKEYNRCRQVWVTGDSISMVYEALSSGCRVGIIPVKWKKTTSKFHRSEEYLKESGLILGLNEYLQGKRQWHNVRPLNEAGRCAEEIIRRFL